MSDDRAKRMAELKAKRKAERDRKSAAAEEELDAALRGIWASYWKSPEPESKAWEKVRTAVREVERQWRLKR